eukprot:TRINITY_DN10415_c0_g1_i1.p1 TRINITY_DN10415_c0_g1~~TRINITY_DN10415_c0_g1_i1.p1  ORF type:complete len:408 (-),score=86.62 TRINITY_DN10415_c0_g1_i1:69-1292(-)
MRRWKVACLSLASGIGSVYFILRGPIDRESRPHLAQESVAGVVPEVLPAADAKESEAEKKITELHSRGPNDRQSRPHLAQKSVAGVVPEVLPAADAKNSEAEGAFTELQGRGGKRLLQSCVSSNCSDCRIASVIAMDLRFIDSPSVVHKLNERMNGTDVFVCTDKKFALRLKVFKGLRAYRFAEQDGGFYRDTKNSSKMIQWWRLSQCWKLIRDYEQRHGFRYAFYFKVRTDCKVAGLGCAAARDVYRNVTKKYGCGIADMAFCRSDYSFGAAARGFERLATIFSRIGSMYWQKEAQWYPLDYDLMLRSEWGGAQKWSWLIHPKDAIKRGHKCCDKDTLRMNLDDLKDFIQSKKVVDGPICNMEGKCSTTDNSSNSAHHAGVTGFPGIPGASKFASEKVMLLDLLLC